MLWAVFVYSPVAHWVWGGGWLDELGAIDFAGGNVVHISSGVAGLVVAIVLGKRKNISDTAPHNLLLTLLGATLIWFGWFGFNVGSALTIDEVAMTAFINTNTAAAAGLIGWILAEWLINKKPTMLGAVSGAIAGLVAITPGAGFVTPFSSVWIGLIGGIVCFWGVFSLKKNSATMMRSMPSDFTGSAEHGAESRRACSRRHQSTQTEQTGFLRRHQSPLETVDCDCRNIFVCRNRHIRYY